MFTFTVSHTVRCICSHSLLFSVNSIFPLELASPRQVADKSRTCSQPAADKWNETLIDSFSSLCSVVVVSDRWKPVVKSLSFHLKFCVSVSRAVSVVEMISSRSAAALSCSN